jgi:hypothetical protein
MTSSEATGLRARLSSMTAFMYEAFREKARGSQA